MRITATDGELQPIVATASLEVEEVEDTEDGEVHLAPTLRRRLAWVPPLALLYVLDKLLALLSPLIHFPASLLGMAAIVALLLAAQRQQPSLALAAELWFRPGVVSRAGTLCCWLPPACFITLQAVGSGEARVVESPVMQQAQLERACMRR